jgi:hypothetical protein
VCYLPDCHIKRATNFENMALLSIWRYCQCGAIVNVALLSIWRYYQYGAIVNMALLSIWRYYQYGAIIFKFLYFIIFRRVLQQFRNIC